MLARKIVGGQDNISYSPMISLHDCGKSDGDDIRYENIKFHSFFKTQNAVNSFLSLSNKLHQIRNHYFAVFKLVLLNCEMSNGGCDYMRCIKIQG
jgi:hypothetical protein